MTGHSDPMPPPKFDSPDSEEESDDDNDEPPPLFPDDDSDSETDDGTFRDGELNRKPQRFAATALHLQVKRDCRRQGNTDQDQNR